MIEKGTLKTVVGDVTTPQRAKASDIVVIPHCCNNRKIMGAGVALFLKTKWPEVDEIYQNSSDELGSVSYYIHTIEDEEKTVDLVVANMIGQDSCRSISNPKPVKYVALMQAMEKVFTFCDAMKINEKMNNRNRNVAIHACKFGSDLAGGNWGFILELINEIWIDKGLDVVVYEFGE